MVDSMSFFLPIRVLDDIDVRPLANAADIEGLRNKTSDWIKVGEINELFGAVSSSNDSVSFIVQKREDGGYDLIWSRKKATNSSN
ncbi:hypothetical protein GCM10009096_07160 [Parasphingorhabdus litoris]|uniref:Uncharacterized protein n=1 Tax=Parasphingorhabdus litoris TaxID=394733 RepID=A0ABN1A6K9_9SPHN